MNHGGMMEVNQSIKTGDDTVLAEGSKGWGAI
jgi:hypothetical protein